MILPAVHTTQCGVQGYLVTRTRNSRALTGSTGSGACVFLFYYFHLHAPLGTTREHLTRRESKGGRASLNAPHQKTPVQQISGRGNVSGFTPVRHSAHGPRASGTHHAAQSRPDGRPCCKRRRAHPAFPTPPPLSVPPPPSPRAIPRGAYKPRGQTLNTAHSLEGVSPEGLLDDVFAVSGRFAPEGDDGAVLLHENCHQPLMLTSESADQVGIMPRRPSPSCRVTRAMLLAQSQSMCHHHAPSTVTSSITCAGVYRLQG